MFAMRGWSVTSFANASVGGMERSLRCLSWEATSEYAGASASTMESFWVASGSDFGSGDSLAKISGCLDS